MTLADRCRLLLAGLHNSENDATLVFERERYRDVMRAALRDPDVRAAVATLPADFQWDRWAR